MRKENLALAENIYEGLLKHWPNLKEFSHTLSFNNKVLEETWLFVPLCLPRINPDHFWREVILRGLWRLIKKSTKDSPRTLFSRTVISECLS